MALEPNPLSVDSGDLALRGETVGDGPAIVLAHGLTATRRQVVHGSNVLPREGYRAVLYDARGHGESDPAPQGSGYSYEELSADLDAVIASAVGEGRVVLAGHSMGAHTVVCDALRAPERVAALVVIGPVYLGVYDEEVLSRWDALADALDSGGIESFLDAVVEGTDPEWRESIRRFTRERMESHGHLDAVVRALREVPRSVPFETMSELEFLDVPALVVASHDEADPRHPYAVAEAYAERLPNARLVSEVRGESPLAWQGGKLSREITAFCAEPAVAERLAG